MGVKWYVAGAVALGLLGVGTAGAMRVPREVRPAPEADASLPPYALRFVKACRSAAARETNAREICSCMVDNLDGVLKTDDEYRLAGEIVKAIMSAGTNRARMQTNFNAISQDFHKVVSVERKAAVLSAVSRNGVSCAMAHQ